MFGGMFTGTSDAVTNTGGPSTIITSMNTSIDNCKNIRGGASQLQSGLSASPCLSSDRSLPSPSLSLGPSPSPSPGLPVVIIGGGLGGMALALALQRKNLPYLLFEKDASFAARKQGYALTLQQVHPYIMNPFTHIIHSHEYKATPSPYNRCTPT